MDLPLQQIALTIKQRELERLRILTGIAGYDVRELELLHELETLKSSRETSNARVAELDAEIANLKK